MAIEVKYPLNVNGKSESYGDSPYYVPAYDSQDDGRLEGLSLSAPHIVRCGLAGDDIPFGSVVYLIRDDVVGSKGAASKAYGVAMRTASDKLHYDKGCAVNILVKGEIYVRTLDDAEANAPVYVDAEGNVHSSSHDGSEEKFGWRFSTSAKASEVVRITLN